MPGIPGRIAPEWVAGINRNQWPDWPGIHNNRREKIFLAFDGLAAVNKMTFFLKSSNLQVA
jgi:hypothetical protein